MSARGGEACSFIPRKGLHRKIKDATAKFFNAIEEKRKKRRDKKLKRIIYFRDEVWKKKGHAATRGRDTKGKKEWFRFSIPTKREEKDLSLAKAGERKILTNPSPGEDN